MEKREVIYVPNIYKDYAPVLTPEIEDEIMMLYRVGKSLRWIRDELIFTGMVKTISHETVRKVINKHVKS